MPAERSLTTLLIAVSLLTAGLALAGTPSVLAVENASHSEESSGTSAASTAEQRSDAGEARHDDSDEGPRNLTLEGQLFDAESDEPLAGVEVGIGNRWVDEDERRGGGGHYVVETDDQGRYTVQVSPGHVALHVDEADYQRVRASFTIQENITLDVPMEPVDDELAHVVGVVESEDGQALADASVRISTAPSDEKHERGEASASSSRSVRQAETDQGSIELRYEPRDDRYAYLQTEDDGSYEVYLPPGSYVAHARAQDHLSQELGFDASEAQHVRADFTLTSIPDASVLVQGTVVDAETGEGVEHARVLADNQRWGTSQSTFADEEGAFSMQVRPGFTILETRAEERYFVPCQEQAHPETGGQDEGASDAREPQRADCDPRQQRSLAYLPSSLTIQPEADEAIELDVELDARPQPNARIEGWVLNATSGEAIEQATIMVRNEITHDRGRAETGEDGSFAIDVKDGYYTVRIRADGFFTNATNLRVEDGEATRATLNLTPGEPARGCCYHAMPVADTAGGDGGDDAAMHGGHAVEDEAAASRQASDVDDGEVAFQGGPGDLGPHPSASTDGGEAVNPAPAPGSLLLAGILASIALAGRLTKRR